ncbi:CDP-alcohol phosphatidyltransferase family protein [Aureibaculum luteum]|uniref:CDP-alcohol phosphatidyltransferase family protein n=1 Tax=Aureibaculum luteum TaxID=1548456 RepID=UPI000E46AF76|nr:CDP-alcohol phosphatidyltransferase family protein [Aureibaculum luteum]
MFIFKILNIADWFSFYRVLAIPILLLLLFMGERQIFAFALLVSYSTDMIDGFLARKLKVTSIGP